MNEEKIDKIIKEKLRNSINVPNMIYEDVDKVLENIQKPKKDYYKRNKILKMVATVLIVSMVGATAYATINNNILKKLNIGKNDTKVEEITDEVLRIVENDGARIEINKLVADDSYMILEYHVEIKEKLVKDYEEIQAMHGESTYLENVVKVKSQYYEDIELEPASEVEQIVEKTANNAFNIYQTLMIADVNLPTEFNLEIEFKNLDIGNSDEEHLIVGFGDYEAGTGLKSSSKIENQDEANRIEIETDNIQENAEPIQEVIESAQQVQEIHENAPMIQDMNETNKAGEKVEIFVNLDKARENSKVNNVNKELKINDNQILKVSEYRETPITNFIKAEIVSKNVNSKDIVENTEKNPLNIIIDIQDENGNSLSHKELKNKSYLKVKEGESNSLDGEILDIDDSLNFENATVSTEYIIAINNLPNDISKIKIVPLVQTNETNNESDKWCKLENGEYTFKNNLGGEIKVNEVKVNDDKLLFYYTKNGCVPGEAQFIIKANEKIYGQNKLYASIYEKDSKVKNAYVSGLYYKSIPYNQINEKEIDLEDIIRNDTKNVEFTVVMNNQMKILNKNGIEFNIKK